MVQPISGNMHRSSHKDTTTGFHQLSECRATEQQKMESFCLESISTAYLTGLGWTDRAVAQFKHAWVDSTRASYLRAIQKLLALYQDRQSPFPPPNSAVVAEFLCQVCDSSEKPLSALKTASAAISAVYECLEITHGHT